MGKRRKNKPKKRLNFKLAVLILSVEVLCCAANYKSLVVLPQNKSSHYKTVAVALPTPNKSPAPTQIPPTPKPTRAPSKLAVPYKPSLARSPLPAPVTASPHSVVKTLVAVAQPIPPIPGRGSLSPDPSPTQAPTSTPSADAPYLYTSSNWSGYLATQGKFTAVSGSWVVPNVTSPGSQVAADAAWVGIGGVTSSDLIQVGTMDFAPRNGQSTYGAFYEVLPDASVPIPNMTISAGDSISASVTESSPGQWNIKIADLTSSETFATSVAYTSSESSAEWIEEDPSYQSDNLIPFDIFGRTDFSKSVTTQSGAVQSAGEAGAQAIIMQSDTGHIQAKPTVLTPDGQSFSVTGE